MQLGPMQRSTTSLKFITEQTVRSGRHVPGTAAPHGRPRHRDRVRKLVLVYNGLQGRRYNPTKIYRAASMVKLKATEVSRR